ISSDCGYTFQEIYRNGGDSLRSHAGINPADSSAFRRIEVDHPLLQRTTPGSYRLRFTSQNDFGGNLYLTNIGLFRFYGLPVTDAPPIAQSWSVYPNPSSNTHLNLQIPEHRDRIRLQIVNQLGQMVWYSEWIDQPNPESTLATGLTHRLEIPDLKPGLYLLNLESQGNPLLLKPAIRYQTLRWIKTP
ncbi:MAG: T9SS type A sorting domain-containing protein, partial [Bacteroidota bacterium]